MYQTQTTTSRRRFLHGGLLGTLALVASLGALPIPDVAAGKKTLAESGLALTSADDLADAAKKVVAAVKARG